MRLLYAWFFDINPCNQISDFSVHGRFKIIKLVPKVNNNKIVKGSQQSNCNVHCYCFLLKDVYFFSNVKLQTLICIIRSKFSILLSRSKSFLITTCVFHRLRIAFIWKTNRSFMNENFMRSIFSIGTVTFCTV